jgi:biopolymer transport protein ExbD
MRKSMSRFSGREEKSEINLTPMLDVVFIMLIFFIVTATFIKEPGQEVMKPEALTGVEKPTVSVLVAINAANEIWIDKKQVDARSVRGTLERLIAENPKGGLVVEADAAAKNEVLMEVLNAARGAGIQQVAVATEE